MIILAHLIKMRQNNRRRRVDTFFSELFSNLWNIMDITTTEIRPLVHRPREARTILCCGKTKFWALVKSGDLDVRKLGRCTLITDESIRSFLATLPPAMR